MSDAELRELDAWIAERVMEWHRKTWRQLWPDYGEYNADELTDDWYDSSGQVARSANGECDCGQNIYGFKPTTDPAAAMEVLKECAIHKSIRIEYDSDKNEWAIIEDDGGWISAKTPELAICLFAKKLFTK